MNYMWNYEKVVLANPQGFCAGVTRAVDTVFETLERYPGQIIYVRHQIVHNRDIIHSLEKRGVQFVESIDQVPYNSIIILSAHGISPSVILEAKKRNLYLIDATCPLVSQIHQQIRRFSQRNMPIILIGHAHHPEVEGSLGHSLGPIFLVSRIEDIKNLPLDKEDCIGYVTQSTLSITDTQPIIDALYRHFSNLTPPSKKSICYATENRQKAVALLADKVDVILVVGSQNSSNANRLVEVSKQNETPAYLINELAEIETSWLCGKKIIGITSGASTPDYAVKRLIESLINICPLVTIESLGDPYLEENIRFALPVFPIILID